MRFNDPFYVEDWVTNGNYPKIHNNIFSIAKERPVSRFVDLCCSTGLLGRRLVDELGWSGCSIDSDARALERGLEAGVFDSIPVQLMKITPATLGELFAFLSDHEVTTVVARRCLCVLWEVVPLDELQSMFLDVGVDTILLEGRRIDNRAVHPLGSADAQAAAFDRFKVTRSFKDIRLLELT